MIQLPISSLAPRGLNLLWKPKVPLSRRGLFRSLHGLDQTMWHRELFRLLVLRGWDFLELSPIETGWLLLTTDTFDIAVPSWRFLRSVLKLVQVVSIRSRLVFS